MTATSKIPAIDDLLSRARRAAEKRQVYEAERMAAKAQSMARQADAFQHLADVVELLAELRRARMKAAVDAADDTVVVIEDQPEPDARVNPGCYLFIPPLVGADARRLRVAAFTQDVPVLVVCREPRTMLGLVPVVAITPGLTVRTKVQPPDDPEAPDLDWFLQSQEQLGDWAIDTLDPELELTRRLDQLLLRLDAVPEHVQLHEEVAQCCQMLVEQGIRGSDDHGDDPAGTGAAGAGSMSG